MKNKALVTVCFLTSLFLTTVMLSSCDELKTRITVKGADGTEYQSYREACSKGDFDAARTFVEKMKEAKSGYHYNDIEEAEEYIFSNELNALAAMNSEQSDERIILLLNEIKMEGETRPEGTCIGKDCYIDYDDRDGKDDAYSNYMSWVSKFNLKCDRIMDIAIACGNQNLAKKMLNMFRQDATFIHKPSAEHPRDERYKDVYAHYTNDSKNAAQKKYQEAISSGAFN